MIADRAGIVAAAHASITKGSRSFALASKLFNPVTRERAWLLYAWCRACDDLADGQVMGHGIQAVDDAAARLATIRRLTEAALAGEPTGDPAFDALGIVARECAIPAHLPTDVIEGFALDAAGWRPDAESGLYRYCYHVAGAVGVMMALVMGVSYDDAATLDRACDLGIAFQLANIARDIVEDAGAGRCYLPATWLAEAGILPDAIADVRYRPQLALLAARLAERAEAYEASARIGAGHLPYRSAWAVLAAAGIYGDIARLVAQRGARAWDRRAATGAAGKLAWVARAAIQALRSFPADGQRDGLWTRPDRRMIDQRAPI